MMLDVCLRINEIECHFTITLDGFRVLLFVRDSGEWDKWYEVHVSAITFLFNVNFEFIARFVILRCM